jgi:predicted small secreted protein
MQKKLKNCLTFAILSVSAILLSQCSTVRGFGQDIQKAGDGISNAASRAAN